MDFDIFLTPPRWDILKIIAEKPSSPVEISEKLNTTVSYVSQQLKLLDAANLLSKEKTGAFEKGKPRTLFSLSNELFYLTLLTRNVAIKKLIPLTEYHKTILKIWNLNEPSLHYYIEKFYWKLEESLEELEGIYIDTSTIDPQIIIISESKKLKQKIEEFIKTQSREIKYSFIQKPQLKKFSFEHLVSLHDPNRLIDELKGGKNLTNE
jgi:predicted transcriptional regulator